MNPRLSLSTLATRTATFNFRSTRLRAFGPTRFPKDVPWPS
jgi:hypothetical protein